MSKKEELTKEITQIWHILVYAKECFQISYYLRAPETELERDYINKSPIFKFIGHSFWRLTIIELSKIYSRSSGKKQRDRFNIFHFISKLKKHSYFGTSGVDQDLIDKWEEILEENESIIQEIITLRDKIYGHTDPNKSLYVNSDITFNQIDSLFDIVEEIIKEVFKQALNQEAHILNSIIGADKINFVKILAESQVQNRITMMENFRKGINPK